MKFQTITALTKIDCLNRANDYKKTVPNTYKIILSDLRHDRKTDKWIINLTQLDKKTEGDLINVTIGN